MSIIEFLHEFNYIKKVFLAKSSFIWKLAQFKYLFRNVEKKLTIITASDSSHYKSLINLLSSIRKNEPDIIVHIWDLGLSNDESISISREFVNYKVIKFPFDRYPQHIRKKSNYAWKPVLIREEFTKQNGLILYLDAGDLVTQKLLLIRKIISSNGFFSPFSSEKIKDWTHSSMITYLKVPNRLFFEPNLNGAIIGFDTNNKFANEMILDWLDCALNESCIAPVGSSRANHRYDQAAMTCLAYMKKMSPRGIHPANINRLGLKIHQDVD